MSDHLLSLSFSLSNVRTTTFREGFPDIFVLANISSTSCFLCSRARHESTQVGRADTSERWERRRGERVPQSQSV